MIAAANLPYEVKRQLLASIRGKLGSSMVDRMIDELGEDGVVDLVLTTLVKANNASSSSSSSSGSVLVGPFILALLAGMGYLLWIGIPWMTSGVGQWWGWLGGHFK